jgi:hypothetical protein
MGNLVDTFIITPKPAWRDTVCLNTEEAARQLSEAIPFRYRRLFKVLILTCNCLNTLLDTRDRNKTLEIMEMASEYETAEIKFSSRYRGECLQQVLRKTFYDTLLIIADDYNQDKYNQFIVVMSDSMITEAQWEKDIPEDQAFLRKSILSLVKSGAVSELSTIEGITLKRSQNGKVIHINR